MDATFTVTNTGDVAGDAVAQMYVGPPKDQPAGVQFAVRQLVQFGRVSLAPGQQKTVTMAVAPRQLSYWSSAAQKWVLDAGGRTLYVGDADAPASLPLQATIAGQQAGTVVCADDQLNAFTISGNLTVSRDHWCDLVDMTVRGNVALQEGSGVRLANSQINGNLVAYDTSDAADPRSAGANVVCGTKIKGNVVVQGSNRSSPWNIGLCGGNSIAGHLSFSGNAARSNFITGSTIRGNLVCDGNGAITASGNTVFGRSEGQCRK